MRKNEIEQRLDAMANKHAEYAAVFALNEVKDTEYEVQDTYNVEKKRFASTRHKVPDRIIEQLYDGTYAAHHHNGKQYKKIQKLFNDKFEYYHFNYRQQLIKERKNGILYQLFYVLIIFAFIAWWGISAYAHHQETLRLAKLKTDISIEDSPTSDTSTPVKQENKETVNMPEPFVVHPGGYAWLVAGTVPGSNCSIDVEYYSGPSHAAGLYPKIADSNGQVRWDWNIGTNTTPGDWPVYVTCTIDGQSKAENTEIYVRE
jgi:hypothetical protein